MPADDWTWPVSSPTAGSVKKQNRTVQFGYGYKQIAPEGRNRAPVTYGVQIRGIEFTELQAAYNFLDARDGMPFLWTPPVPPITTQQQWTCEEYDWMYEGGLIAGLNAKFEIFNTS
jgi:phage-related protein